MWSSGCHGAPHWASPRAGGADAAVGLLAAFAPDLPGLPAAVTAAAGALALPNGGVRPGEDTRLDWLDRHRTPSGAIPERVAADGSPSSVVPLGGAVLSYFWHSSR